MSGNARKFVFVLALSAIALSRCSKSSDTEEKLQGPRGIEEQLPQAEGQPPQTGPEAFKVDESKKVKTKGEIITDIVPRETQNLYGAVVWNMANIYQKPDLLSERIGYFRTGTTILLGERVKPTNPKSPKCVHGWYRLLDGAGYICASKGFQIASVLMKSPDQINPPTTEEVLPYRYGRIMVNLTPLYERIPTAEEQAMVAKYVTERKKELLAEKKAKEMAEMEAQRKKPEPDIEKEKKKFNEETAAEEAEAAKTPDLKKEEPGGETSPAAAGVSGEKEKEAEPALKPEEKTQESSEEEEEKEEEEEEEEEKEEEEEEKEEIPFSFVSALLMRGFYLSIDDEVIRGGSRWYKTTRGKYVRRETVLSVNPLTAHGFHLPEGRKFPVGLVLRKNIFARKWNSSGKHLVKNKDIVFDKFFGFPIHKKVTDLDKLYFQIDDEGKTFILSWSAVVFSKPVKRPAEIPEGSKWIHVDVSDQTLTAYEGDKPVFVTLVSSGAEKKDEEYMTPRGLYWIISKNVTSTMANLALDEEAYWIEDVPWTMYFYKSFALHGAFWHNVFGNQRSHGCVNLAPDDARWLFYWSEPQIPLGWHGVYTTKKNKGTPVYITN